MPVESPLKPLARVTAAALATLVAAGCAVTPVALKDDERRQAGESARTKVFAGTEPITQPLTLYEATARAIKYQADYRVRILEQALSLGQLDVSQFDMLPRLTANAGYTWRNNESFGFGFNPSGDIATNPSASQERMHNTGGLSFTWSILDFGLSYYRAKQLADQSLIADERRRRAMQNLVQDVRLAWWRAEAAQRLVPRIDKLIAEVNEIVEKSRIIEKQKLLPPLQVATVRRGLLDLEQEISFLRQQLAQSQIELASLVNAPPGSMVRVATPPAVEKPLVELRANIDTLETVALRNRPEIAEETYKARVNADETRKSILALFPNLNIDFGGNYDSNKYLVNNSWLSAGWGVAFNLVRLFSYPAIERQGEAQGTLDEARRAAMAMAVLTQTRIAGVRYGLLAQEFEVWDEATRDDQQILDYLASSNQVGIDTEYELLRARMRYLVSNINRDWVYASLEGALARIYNSVGMDALPDEVASHQTSELAKLLKTRIDGWTRENFAARPDPRQVDIALGDIRGVPKAALPEFRKASEQIIGLAQARVSDRGRAQYRLNASVDVDPGKTGGKSAQMKVSLVDTLTGAVAYESEMKTTLSEPVNIDQWRALGEGAAYRVVGPISQLRAGRELEAPAPAGDGQKPAAPPKVKPSAPRESAPDRPAPPRPAGSKLKLTRSLGVGASARHASAAVKSAPVRGALNLRLAQGTFTTLSAQAYGIDDR